MTANRSFVITLERSSLRTDYGSTTDIIKVLLADVDHGAGCKLLESAAVHLVGCHPVVVERPRPALAAPGPPVSVEVGARTTP